MQKFSIMRSIASSVISQLQTHIPSLILSVLRVQVFAKSLLYLLRNEDIRKASITDSQRKITLSRDKLAKD